METTNILFKKEMVTVLQKKDITEQFMREEMTAKSLKIFWSITVEMSDDLATITPTEIDNAILDYEEDGMYHQLELKEWNKKFYFLQERESPTQWYIIDAFVDFQNKELILSL